MKMCSSAFAKLLLVTVLISAPRAASAQYAQDQPKALKSLKKVRINFAEPNKKISEPTLQGIFGSATLELRKAGIRIVNDTTEFDRQSDALLNLTVFITTGIADQVVVRMDVEQLTTMVRTKETLQLVTWYFEDSFTGGSWRDSVPTLVTKAVNKLLADWLDANGR